MAIEKALLDQLLAGRDPKDVFNKEGLVDELKKALSERILNTELDEHLDGDGAEGKSNHRNGYSKKSVLTGTSKMTLSVPRDRAGTFAHPPFDGFCLLEGSQERGAGIAHGLSRGRCSRRPGRPRRLCARSVGRKVSGNRAELASQLGARDSFLRFPGRRTADHLHHEFHRSAEFEAAPRRQNQRTFPI